jgi:hypothetical protein
MDLISIFNKVRDIPLRMLESSKDEDQRCWGKHRKLFTLLNQAGLKVRYRVCEFSWSEQKFPKEVLNFVKQDREYHLFLEAEIGGKWVIIDCSNDFRLSQYNKWDGKSDCELGVIPDKILATIESSFIEKQEPFKREEILAKNLEFYKAANKFLDSIRQKFEVK